MKNSIAERIADFLKSHPPFLSLALSDLIIIAKEAEVIYLERNQILFKVNDLPHSSFYIVKDGSVRLSIDTNGNEILIDQCDEGDILGLRPFFAKDNYVMQSMASEESLLYAIPITIFKNYAFQNPAILEFLLQSFASNTRNPYDKVNKGKLLSENINYNEQETVAQFYKAISFTSNPITATGKETIKTIAETMVRYKIGSVLIEKNKLPIGIITDKDLRSKIATGLFTIFDTAEEIMSSPVITVPGNSSIADVQLLMMKYSIGHLCVTADGTAYSAIIGVVSEHDVFTSQANNPGVLLKQTKRATSTEELRLIRGNLTTLIQNSVKENIPIAYICQVSAEINTAITKRAIEIALTEMSHQPQVKFAWLNIGSQGRKEQLLLTDQDNALVFDDVEAEEYDIVKNYFVTLSQKVTAILNIVGYEYCPANMMASNPSWCQSLREWKQQYSNWINNPGKEGILMCSIFFDYDFVYGDQALANAIRDTILQNTTNNQIFFSYLGADALKSPPPLGFFRQFLVEKDGAHKDNFDLKARCLMPLIDVARVLCLHQKVSGLNNTILRFEKLVALEPQNEAIYQACIDAFSLLLKLRTEEGFASNSSGRYLDLNTLSKLDKLKLKNAFVPIKDIQEIIKTRFQLTYFT